MKFGNVYWITGLPGAGKSTLAAQYLAYLKAQGRCVVLLDGDQLRTALGRSQDYSLADRQELALSYGRLSLLFAQQGLDVICATVSLFHICHQWNRQHIQNYTEIFLSAPADLLQARDQKQLYSKARAGQQKNVMGYDQEPEWPQAPDICLEITSKSTPESVFQDLLKHKQDL